MKKFVIRTTFTLYISVTILALCCVMIPDRPCTITLGALAEKKADFRDKRIRIVNATSGTKIGRFVVFEAGNESRHCVILALAELEVKPGTDFSGYCVGLVDYPIEGVPHKPPFIYIVDAKPIRLDPLDRP